MEQQSFAFVSVANLLPGGPRIKWSTCTICFYLSLFRNNTNFTAVKTDKELVAGENNHRNLPESGGVTVGSRVSFLHLSFQWPTFHAMVCSGNLVSTYF